MLEKKTRAETEVRLSAEKQLAELQAQKLEEAAATARTLTTRYITAIRTFLKWSHAWKSKLDLLLFVAE